MEFIHGGAFLFRERDDDRLLNGLRDGLDRVAEERHPAGGAAGHVVVVDLQSEGLEQLPREFVRQLGQLDRRDGQEVEQTWIRCVLHLVLRLGQLRSQPLDLALKLRPPLVDVSNEVLVDIGQLQVADEVLPLGLGLGDRSAQRGDLGLAILLRVLVEFLEAGGQQLAPVLPEDLVREELGEPLHHAVLADPVGRGRVPLWNPSLLRRTDVVGVLMLRLAVEATLAEHAEDVAAQPVGPLGLRIATLARGA
ncbi:hypothetical protein SK854_14430 [Lentzea sp. BCCO 10_0061]|uniref:Uncharacterized protein n=1 Tax=Lentzea sokolovensis TaxID=3095429 RepID=A0ABU4UUZ0_9PSEU|nr:hypothetical protein [Lentzea sp. BCCO 10_0061]MDX8143322.1 hypothetical protein [Lentzea sp. BCCO 10_0061]